MQFERPVRDPLAFTHFLRRPSQPVRVQTVSAGPSGLGAVLDRFEEATGLPYLVNTSFNGVSEPIVATQSDAVRCFFGSGLDLSMINGFWVSK